MTAETPPPEDQKPSEQSPNQSTSASLPDSTSSTSESQELWYKNGLKFRCTQCGNCCTGAPGVVWVDDEEVQAIADFLDKPVGEIRLMHTRPFRNKVSLTEFANGDCTFFDPESRGCLIYPVRPKQCRTWPFWSSNLADEKAWGSIKGDCPGAGCGDLISFDEIEIRRSVIDI